MQYGSYLNSLVVHLSLTPAKNASVTAQASQLQKEAGATASG